MQTNKFYRCIIFFIFFLICLKINCTEANYKQQMKELANELRCMVCQNQSLLESDSELAKDIKKLIQEKLEAGQSEKEIKAFLVERYGEFILFNPLFKPSNIILWISPFLSLAFIGFIALRKTRFNSRKR